MVGFFAPHALVALSVSEHLWAGVAVLSRRWLPLASATTPMGNKMGIANTKPAGMHNRTRPPARNHEPESRTPASPAPSQTS